MEWRRFGLACCLLACTLSRASAARLGPGDPAPRLIVGEWIQGAPLIGLQTGRPILVDFWGTWTAQTQRTIPHLDALQKRYPQVTVLGIAVWEPDPSKVRPFVRKMEGRMSYRVATDRTSNPADPRSGEMARGWLDAAGETGLPAAFLVAADGRIAWIGNPLDAERPLKQVLAGTWSIPQARKERSAEQARATRLQEIERNLTRTAASGDQKALVAAIDRAVRADPSLEGRLALVRLKALSRGGGSAAQVTAYAGRLVKEVLRDSAQGLHTVAWTLVDPERPRRDAAALKVALSAAERANQVAGGRSPAILDTLARAHFVNGHREPAIETQRRAIELGAKLPTPRRKELSDRLREYERTNPG